MCANNKETKYLGFAVISNSISSLFAHGNSDQQALKIAFRQDRFVCRLVENWSQKKGLDVQSCLQIEFHRFGFLE